MIALLRKIRRDLLEQNRFGKYILYALGEILLVVVGILIALQINNWNEERKLEQRDIEIAREVYTELLQNLAYTQTEVKNSQERLEFTQDLIDVSTSKNTLIDQRDFDRLLTQVLGFGVYAPIASQARRVASLDQFEFMRSPDLDGKLAKYVSSLDIVEEYFDFNADTWKMVIQPYLIESYNLLSIEAIWLNIDVPESAANSDYRSVMADPQFTNILAAVFGDVAAYIWVADENLSLINSLITVLETDYPMIMEDSETTKEN